MFALRQLFGWSEFRFAARRLRRAPGFSVAVILVLAVGVGTTTALFSLVNGILLQPLPYPESDRLVRLTHTVSNAGRETVDLSDSLVLLYQDQAQAFDGVAAWRFDDGDLGALEADQTAVRVRGARVTANFFDVMAVRPAIGRTFESGEDRPGAGRVVVLSHHLWQERLHGDPDAIGRQVVVNHVPRTIVGIMPPDFAYPARQVELWLPLALDPARTRPATINLVGIGRLQRDVLPEAARADLARVLTRIGESVPGDASAAAWQEMQITPSVQSLRDSIVGPISHLLWFVFGSVLLVLLVACTNVAGLFLLRAERGQMELAVRAALGSDFLGMLALTLSESVVLSILGGGAGVLLAMSALKLVLSTGTALSLPRLEDVDLSNAVLLFALGLTVFCGLFVSVLPFLRTRRVSIAQVLQRAGSGSGGDRSGRRVRDALVVCQIALAVVLVALAGLMTRSFLRLQEVKPGFDAADVVTSRVLLPYASYNIGARLGFFETLVRQAEALPGVQNVALTHWVPLSGDHHDLAIEVEGDLSRTSAGGAEHSAAWVNGPYFQTLRIPLLRGQSFGPQDANNPSSEAMVSQAFAQRYWPGISPLGKRVRSLGGNWHTVIGEVGDVHYDRLEEPANAMVYFPIVSALPGVGPVMPPALSLLVRTRAGASGTLSDLRGIVRALDPSIPTYDEGLLTELVRNVSARARALVGLLAIAALMTSLLGGIGLYGITAYSVSLRRRELGIRMALGAGPEDVSRMVSLDGLRLAGLGIVFGIAGTLALSRLMQGLLYGVSPADPLALAVTVTVLLSIALVASWIPARRAAAVSPAESLQV